MMAGIFTAQAVGGGVSGRGGSGVSGTYVAAFYLGGTLAGVVYPPFLHLGTVWALGLAFLVTLMALGFAGRAMSEGQETKRGD